jgi:hypothetical protein
MKWLIVCLLALFLVAPAMAGEDPYIAVVGDDILANQFYLSPKYVQFLHAQTPIGIPIAPEGFSTNEWIGQPEICDTTGVPIGSLGNYTGFVSTKGLTNARVTAGNQAYYQWTVALPKKPSGEINLCIQCGILKPDAFTFWGFESVLDCAAETGERIGNGFCVRERIHAGENPVVITALPTITATVTSGQYAPISGTFHLTAFRNPGTYDPFDTGSPAKLVNGATAQALVGTDPSTRILLKSCMDKCIVAKLPVTGQVNALGETEFDLEAGDLVTVRLNVPRDNTVDIYCHSQSLRLMGIGEAPF